MALKPCRECKKEVSAEAATCPHCGVSRPVPKGVPGSVGCLLPLGALVIAIAYCQSNTPKPPPGRPGAAEASAVKMDARIVCEDFVKRRLKAPSTAKVYVAGTTEEAVSDLGGGKWRVEGYREIAPSALAVS